MAEALGTRAYKRSRGRTAQVFAVIAAITVAACSSAPYRPAPLDSVAFRDRAQTQTAGAIAVSAAVPGPEETSALFDLPLYDDGIQPVWLEVRNGTDSSVRYAPVSTDRESFAPQEVAYDLAKPPTGEAVPTFMVGALKDPWSGNFDRIQIVKGWIDDKGKRQEMIYDVACADRRISNGKRAGPIGNTVDEANATCLNDIGDEQIGSNRVFSAE